MSSNYQKKYVLHPSYIVLYLLLAGITMLFLAFCGGFLYHRIDQGIVPMPVPLLFYTNSILLVASSYFLHQAYLAYQNDLTEKYKICLAITLVLSVIFMIAQYFAWVQMLSQNIKLQGTPLASYLYLISFVHFMHIGVGIPFLARFTWVAFYKMIEPVSVLIYFTDGSKKRQLKLLMTYWHYLDILWIFLVVFFMLNYFISF